MKNVEKIFVEQISSKKNETIESLLTSASIAREVYQNFCDSLEGGSQFFHVGIPEGGINVAFTNAVAILRNAYGLHVERPIKDADKTPASYYSIHIPTYKAMLLKNPEIVEKFNEILFGEKEVSSKSECEDGSLPVFSKEREYTFKSVVGVALSKRIYTALVSVPSFTAREKYVIDRGIVIKETELAQIIRHIISFVTKTTIKKRKLPPQDINTLQGVLLKIDKLKKER